VLEEKGPVERARTSVSNPRESVVVVVENDDGMRRALQRMLEISGFATATFGSAEALLAVDGASGARCLVLDIQLPGMSGFDLHRHLYAGGVPPPVIFITGYDSAAARDQAEALGAVAYLPKPFAVEMLVDAVSRAGGSPPAGVA
jgi:FixJ family two-component response regulator